MLGTNRQWYLIYCIYGYGVPLIIVLTAIIAHHAPGDHIKPRIGEHSCWFTGGEITYFPMKHHLENHISYRS